jgi:hypothetical protein
MLSQEFFMKGVTALSQDTFNAELHYVVGHAENTGTATPVSYAHALSLRPDVAKYRLRLAQFCTRSPPHRAHHTRPSP